MVQVKKIVYAFIFTFMLFFISGCGPSEQDVLLAAEDIMTAFTSMEFKLDSSTAENVRDYGVGEESMENSDGSVRWDIRIELTRDELTMTGVCNIIDYLGTKTDSYMHGKIQYYAEGNIQSQDVGSLSMDFDISFDVGKVESFRVFVDNEIMEQGKEPTLYINNKEFIFTDYARIEKIFKETSKILIR